jgi:hypothetical protein
MAPVSLNPFTIARRRKEAEAEAKRKQIQQQEALARLQQPPARNVAQQVAHGRVLAREPSRRQGDLATTLTVAQDSLQRLRNKSASDLEAFPLVNDTQRLGEDMGATSLDLVQQQEPQELSASWAVA